MILRNSAAALCSSSNALLSPSIAITSSWRSSRPPRVSHRRAFASVQDSDPEDASRGINHPNWPTSPAPTPYEIFNLVKGAPYSKTRFYELVKLYHPDRHPHTAHDGIPHLTKLERYRLVILANNILSDPEKRSLYDQYGSGWEGQADLRERYRDADRAWHRQPGNASMNATWEDWERWRDEQDGKKQQPVFMSNGSFVILIGMFALIGGLEHLTRAESHSANLIDMRDKNHASISKGMHERQSTVAGLSKEARVQHFLRQREGWGYDLPRHAQNMSATNSQHPNKETPI
ncbi:hypothetical protein OQA88_8088 [Cercophora sp. LCS_1]